MSEPENLPLSAEVCTYFDSPRLLDIDMKKLILATVTVFSMTFAAHAAIDAEEVRTAMLDRAAASQVIIADLNDELASATGSEIGRIRSEIRIETARARQLESFARIVRRLPERRLELIIARFNLPISVH